MAWSLEITLRNTCLHDSLLNSGTRQSFPTSVLNWFLTKLLKTKYCTYIIQGDCVRHYRICRRTGLNIGKGTEVWLQNWLANGTVPLKDRTPMPRESFVSEAQTKCQAAQNECWQRMGETIVRGRSQTGENEAVGAESKRNITIVKDRVYTITQIICLRVTMNIWVLISKIHFFPKNVFV